MSFQLVKISCRNYLHPDIANEGKVMIRNCLSNTVCKEHVLGSYLIQGGQSEWGFIFFTHCMKSECCASQNRSQFLHPQHTSVSVTFSRTTAFPLLSYATLRFLSPFYSLLKVLVRISSCTPLVGLGIQIAFHQTHMPFRM